MNLQRVHIEFWRASPLPGFALRFYLDAQRKARGSAYAPQAVTRRDLVNRCVNAHAGIKDSANLDAWNFVSLLRMWRHNAERGAHRPPQSLSDYLLHLVAFDTCKGRAHIAARCLRKLKSESQKRGELSSARYLARHGVKRGAFDPAVAFHYMQDGRDFYRVYAECDGGAMMIATYPDTVRNDFDMAGSRLARMRFLADFPNAVQFED